MQATTSHTLHNIQYKYNGIMQCKMQCLYMAHRTKTDSEIPVYSALFLAQHGIRCPGVYLHSARTSGIFNTADNPH